MFDQILDSLSNSNVFLTGGAGVGKSYITKMVIKHYRKSNKNVVALGSTGISAVAIFGVTIHSFFKFGICSNLKELMRYDHKQKHNIIDLNKIIKKIDLLVIDEISMVSSDLIDMIYFRLFSANFTGKVMLVGDFYQLPPVVKNSTQSMLFNLDYAFNSSAWGSIDPVNIELTISKRTQDTAFYHILSKLRLGIIDNSMVDFFMSRLGNQNGDETMLFGTNKKSNLINEYRLSKLNTKLEIYHAIVKILDDQLRHESLNKWINNLSSPLELKLKIGARVIFLINKKGEYYNGEQGIVVDFIENDDVQKQNILVKKDSGEIVRVERYEYYLYEYVSQSDELKENVRASFSQFPLKLAYAITIHKSQGMSIDRFVCNIDDLFADGQLYVGISRATNVNGLTINYNLNKNLMNYLQSVVRPNADVNEFYANNNFIKES